MLNEEFLYTKQQTSCIPDIGGLCIPQVHIVHEHRLGNAAVVNKELVEAVNNNVLNRMY